MPAMAYTAMIIIYYLSQ